LYASDPLALRVPLGCVNLAWRPIFDLQYTLGISINFNVTGNLR
jgi:hypothetical protein